MGVFGVILGILGLIAAVIATLAGGWIGGAIAIVLGAVAVCLGMLARKKNGKGGMGAIVTGILAVVIAFALIFAVQNLMKTMKDKIMENPELQLTKFPTVSKYIEKADTNTGLVGFVGSMAVSITEEDKAAFDKEAKELATVITDNSTSSGTKTEESKPAEEPAAEAPAEEPAAEPAAEGGEEADG